MKDKDVLYKTIKKRRKELNMSQQELAELVGYSGKSMISQVEKGLIDISSSTITKFAIALKCSESYLMGWTDNPDPLYVLTDDYEIEEYDQMMQEALDKMAHIQVKEQINQREALNKAISLYEKYKNAPEDIQSAIETLLKSVQQEP